MSFRRKQTKPRFLKAEEEVTKLLNGQEPSEEIENSVELKNERLVEKEGPSKEHSSLTECTNLGNDEDYNELELCKSEESLVSQSKDAADNDQTNSKYRCEVCGLEFLDLAVFMVHKNDVNCCAGKLDSIAELEENSKVGSSDLNLLESVATHTTALHEDFSQVSCSVCHETFANLKQLREHELVHAEELPYRCDFCQKPFRHKRSCDQHMKLHTGDKHYICDICQAAFSRSEYLKNHIKSHTSSKLSNWSAAKSAPISPEKASNCTSLLRTTQSTLHKVYNSQLIQGGKRVVCEEEFAEADQLDLHMKGHNRESDIPAVKSLDYQCTHCAKQSLKQVFASLQALEQHVTHMHSGKGVSLLSCPRCEAAFPTVPTLNNHIDQVHTKVESRRRCNSQLGRTNANTSEDLVTKMFTTANHLLAVQDHMARISTTPLDLSSAKSPSRLSPLSTLYCQLCSDSFSTKDTLLQHMRGVHKMLGCCNLCSEIFTSSRQQLNHFEQHYLKTTESAFCKSCSLSFTDSSQLKSHLMSNHACIVHKCTICGNVYMSEQDIKRHMSQEHSAELKVHRCTCCDKDCESIEVWQLHIKNSHPELLLTSTESNGSQTSDGHLKCPYCVRSFNVDTELTIHIISHQKSFACTICDEEFQVEYFRDKHIQAVHAPLPASKNSLPSSAATQSNGIHHPFWCKICDRLFHSEDIYEEHKLKNHIVKAWPKNGEISTSITSVVKPKLFSLACLTCGKAFKTSTELEKHSRVHYGPVSLTCVICDVVCPSLTDMAKHKLLHCKVPLTKPCILCNTDVTNAHEYMEHTSSHVEDDSTISCCVCKQKVTSKVELELHAEFHFPIESQFSCASCKKKCPNGLMLPNVNVGFNHQFLLCQDCLLSRNETTSVALQTGLLGIKPLTPAMGDSRSPLLCPKLPDMRSPLPRHTLSSSSSSPRDLFETKQSVTSVSSPHLITRCPECLIKFETAEEFNLHNCVRKSCSKCHIVCNISDMVVKFGSHFCKNCDYSTDLWRCEKCKITFTREDKYRKHNCIALGEGKACNVCQQSFKHSQLLLRDDKLICKECNLDLVTCSDCKNTYSSSGSKHSCKHQCQQCYKNLPREDFLNTHDSRIICKSCSNKSEKIYQCIKCQRVYNSEEEIKAHILATHIKEKTHSCFLCTSYFATPAKLQCHLIEHDFGFTKRMSCPMCPYVTNDASKLMSHCGEHAVSGRPYACSSCNQTFFFESELINHSHNHTNKHIKSLPLRNRSLRKRSVTSDDELSSKKARSSSNEESDNEDGLFCMRCDQEFRDVAQFTLHVRVVHKDDAYECSQCDRIYSSKQDLLEHKKSRHKVYDYVISNSDNMIIHCPLCYQSIGRASYQSHLESDHHELMGKCIMCDFKPTSPLELIKHYTEHKHNMPQSSTSTATTVV